MFSRRRATVLYEHTNCTTISRERVPTPVPPHRGMCIYVCVSHRLPSVQHTENREYNAYCPPPIISLPFVHPSSPSPISSHPHPTSSITPSSIRHFIRQLSFFHRVHSSLQFSEERNAPTRYVSRRNACAISLRHSRFVSSSAPSPFPVLARHIHFSARSSQPQSNAKRPLDDPCRSTEIIPIFDTHPI